MLNNNNKMNNNINTILHHLLGGKHGIEELNNILSSNGVQNIEEIIGSK